MSDVSFSSAAPGKRAGMDSIGVGDADLGGGGKGLLRSLESVDDVGEDNLAVEVDVKSGPGGDDGKLSNDTV